MTWWCDLQTALAELKIWWRKTASRLTCRRPSSWPFGREEKAQKGMPSPLKTVNDFRYLGITLQTTTNSFRCHIQEWAIPIIKDLPGLSLATARVEIFKTTISPIVTYGMELIWEKLKIRDFERIENVKARFLKSALRVGKTAPTRMVYVLTREPFYVEELRTRLLLPSTWWEERQNEGK